MSVIIAHSLRKTYGEKILLNDVSFSIESKQRIGLIGANGTGKTSLLNILYGGDSPEHGEVNHANKFTVQYVTQEPELDESKTVLDTVLDGPSTVMRTLRDYNKALVNYELQQGSDASEQALFKAQANMDAHDGWAADTKAKTVLSSSVLNNHLRLLAHFLVDRERGWLSHGLLLNLQTCSSWTSRRTI